MKQRFQFFMALLFLTGVTADSKNLKELNLASGLIDVPTPEAVAMTKKVPFSRQRSSREGDVLITDNEILIWKNKTIQNRLALHTSDSPIRSALVSSEGDAVVYVVEESGTRQQRMYIRRRWNDSAFSLPQIAYQTRLPAPFERMQVCGLSDDGETVLWRENTVSGERIMALKALSSMADNPVELFSGRHVSYEAFLSGDGNWALFFVWRSKDSNLGQVDKSTLYSHHENGAWSLPNPIEFDGAVNHSMVRSVNHDGTHVVLDNQVIERSAKGFMKKWEFQLDYNTFDNVQISDDCNTVTLQAYDYEQKIQKGQENTQPVIKHLALLRYLNGTITTNYLDSGEILCHRLRNDGKKLVWYQE